MKISLEWISQYVDISDISPDVLLDRLTMGCSEIEKKIDVKRYVEGIYAGKILSVKEIPGKAQNRFVEVDCGGKKYTTVCSAPNARVGLKSFFAPAGAYVADGIQVKAITENGITSE